MITLILHVILMLLKAVDFVVVVLVLVVNVVVVALLVVTDFTIFSCSQ